MERIITSDKNIIVIYHSNCEDGFCSAWAARKKLGDSADYFEFQNGDTLKLDSVGKKIYFLDVVPVPEELYECSDKNDVMVIDHHATSEKRLEKISNKIFDLKHSGAYLSWKYFNPDEDVPKLIYYIEDQDLWLWKLPDSKSVYAYISTFKFTFEHLETLAEELENNHDQIVEKGELIIKSRNIIVENIIGKSAVWVEFEGHKVKAVNSSALGDYVGEALYNKYPPFAIIWFRDKEGIRISLRGLPDTVDLSKLAEKYGGGGHKSSCGFRLRSPDEMFPWKIINNSKDKTQLT